MNRYTKSQQKTPSTRVHALTPLHQLDSQSRRFLQAWLCCAFSPTDQEIDELADKLGMRQVRNNLNRWLIHESHATRVCGQEGYWSSEYFMLRPELAAEVMKGMTPEDVDALTVWPETLPRSWGRRYAIDPGYYARWLKAVCGSALGRVCEQVPDLSSADEEEEKQPGGALYFYRWRLVPLAQALLRDPHWSSIKQVLPNMTADIILDGMIEYAADHPAAETDEPIRDFLIETGRRTGRRRYEGMLSLRCDFPQKGLSREVLAASAGCAFSDHVLSAVAALSQDEPGQAVSHMRDALREEGKRRIFKSVTDNWFYGLALWRDRESPASQKIMKSLSGFAPVNRPECCALKMFCLIGTNCDPTDAARELLDTLPSHLLIHRAAVGMIIRAFHLKGLCEHAYTRAIDQCSALSAYWHLENCNQCGTQRDTDALSAQLQMKPLLPKMDPVPEWEQLLDRLIARESSRPEETSAARERMLYLLDRTELSVEPRLQKSKDGIAWSRGRTVALSQFRETADSLTEQDRRVANHIRVRKGSYGKKNYSLSGKALLETLIGCPLVFDARNPELRLDIVKEPLQISVLKKPDGSWAVKSNLPEEAKLSDGVFVRDVGGACLRVIRPDEDQMLLLKELRSVPDFPSEAQGKLTTFLEKLSRTMPVMSDLLRNTRELEKRKGDSRVTFRFRPEGDGFGVQAAIRPLVGSELSCRPGEGLEFLAATADGRSVQVHRDLQAESANMQALSQALLPLDRCREEEFGWITDFEDCLAFLEILRVHSDAARIEWPEGEEVRISRPAIGTGDVRLSLCSMGQWLSLEGEVRLDRKTRISVAELLQKVREARSDFIELGDKEYVALTDALRRQLAVLDGLVTRDRGGLKVSQFNAGFIDGMTDSGMTVDADEASRSLMDRIRTSETIEAQIPDGLRAELRDYQTAGFRWLFRLACWGAGAVLADDMGLGKTLQTIALLLSRADRGPSLVVVPTAVLCNWQEELARFAPGLRAVVYASGNRGRNVRDAGPGDVLLCTYGVMAGDIEILQTRDWNVAVLDEAHTIKNRETKMSKAAMALTADMRVLLTGTPLQNHLSEIWNLFEFSNPGLLGSYGQFSERFILPIEKDRNRERQRLLKRLLSPFILRRTKSEVLNELPEKTEMTLRVSLSIEERALYEQLREEASVSLETNQVGAIEALTYLTRLRQAACHPRLVNARLALPSSKTKAFLDLSDELQAGGHRALVFSQFTSHLSLIREALDEKGIRYLYLDGSHSASQRKKLVEEFQQGTMPLFLISLKAGGTGLNLTAADYVIHLDPWWNPAVEDQASDRAYRIGQEQPVTIYRLIAENTIEEKILRLHATKKSLADALLDGSDMSGRLSRDEILQLLSAEF